MNEYILPRLDSAKQSLLAPSEKHLEDWIIDNPRRFGEVVTDDLVPREYWPDDAVMLNEDSYISEFFSQTFARQFPLPSGIPDLICHGERRLTVVELKKGLINYDAIGQCVRYMHDLSLMYEQVYVNAEYSGDSGKVYQYDRRTYPGISYDYYEKEVSGMVIGSGVQDKNITFVAEASGIQVINYQYLDDAYWFESAHAYQGTLNYEKYRPHINGIMGKAMRLVMFERATEQKRLREAWRINNHD